MTIVAGPWNWLEIAKLLSELLIPAALAVFGIYIQRLTKRIELVQWRSQKLIEKRLAIYDDLAPSLNDILCYFTYVGPWRDMDPPDVVKLKREVDGKIFLAAPLFGNEFFAACSDFQSQCFEKYTGWVNEAYLRTDFQQRREARSEGWHSDWEKYFSQQVTDPTSVRAAYRRVMDAFASDIGVHATFILPHSGPMSKGIG
jgi:hypothetical protein